MAALACLLNSRHSCTGEAAGKPGTDKDFWNRALQTPINDKQQAKGSDVHYPELYRGAGGGTMPTGQVTPYLGQLSGSACQLIFSSYPEGVCRTAAALACLVQWW